MRRASIVCSAAAIATLISSSAAAQNATAGDGPLAVTPLVADSIARVNFALDETHGDDQQKPPDPQQPTEPQKPEGPPAAVGEEGNKPTRGFASSLLHNLKDDLAHLPRWNSVAVLAIGGGAAAAVHPYDPDINQHLVGTADWVWVPGKVIGSAYTILGAATTTYIIGRTTHSPRAQHLGMDEIEASILTGGIVFGIKQSVRRERPLDAEGQPQSGFAFPSGHAAGSFAAATVLQQHLGYRAGIPTYLVATYVAMSRLHDNKHWASDVAFGSAIGVMVGRTVTWHGRHFYGSPIFVPGGTGIAFAFNTGPSRR